MCCCPCPTSQTKQRMNLIITMEVLELANIKSAKKRILVAEKRAEKNKSVRSRVKTAVKKVDAAIAANEVCLQEYYCKKSFSFNNRCKQTCVM